MMNLINRPSSSLGITTLEELDKIFDNFVRSSAMPSIDIYSEDDQHMIIEVQTPGFKEDDISINVRNGILEIKGETRSNATESSNKKRNYLMRESYASFARRVVLPETAKAEDISAELDNGVLKIEVPVERPEAKKVKIINKSSKTPKEISK